jgi:imidazole glycerol-phosphate synthase subunit HisF
VRKILKLDVKNNNLVKGRQLEGVRRYVPLEDLNKYFPEECFDEIVIMDYTKSNFGLEPNYKAVEDISFQYNLPITYGGGIKTIDHVFVLSDCGASRYYLNSIFSDNNAQDVIYEMHSSIGSQSIVLGMEYRTLNNNITCYYNAGRDMFHDGFEDHLSRLLSLPLGEIMLTNISRDGMLSGLDCAIINRVDSHIPVILSGGFDGSIPKVCNMSGFAASSYHINKYIRK